jgi:hypothetical protein
LNDLIKNTQVASDRMIELRQFDSIPSPMLVLRNVENIRDL